MKTNVYIDGFNLYYRAVKNTPFKWLDLGKMCEALLPSHDIQRIRYFTAKVSGADHRQRQIAYIRAIETIPYLSVHYGTFKTRTKKGLLVTPVPGAPAVVEILTTEEKGSDVNLATYLLSDGYRGEYEQAVIVSNDSDLALPIEVVRKELPRRIGVVNPNRNPKQITPKELIDAASFTLRLFKTTLRDNQFPPEITDALGTFKKPSSW